jgi:multiple sugar transport system substrate-binding protein
VISRLLSACITWSTIVASASASASSGGCGVSAGSVRIISNDFPSLRIVAAEAEECASAGVSITKNQTTQHAMLQVPALKTDPAKYTVAVVSNNSMTSLLNDGLIRPLDSLIAKYGQQLDSKQLVKINGHVMAIAFMIDAQHLFYREDVLRKAGVAVPKTYEEVLAAARIIRDKGIMRYPLAATDRPDWDLGEEFINMYLAYGGVLFDPYSAQTQINNDKGAAALEMMKALAAYMRPEFLTFDTEAVAPIWEAGDVAIANLWGTRAESFLSGSGSVYKVAEVTRFAAAPTVAGGTIPATALWWDGFTIAKNISDADAEASFRVMMHAISPEMANAHQTAAVWLTRDFKPSPAAIGVLASVAGGAKSYPMQPYMGYLHSAIGSNIAGFMQGRDSAREALNQVVATYTTAVREAGYLN